MNEEVKACAECGSPNTSASQFCSPPCFEKAVARQSRTPASCSPDVVGRWSVSFHGSPPSAFVKSGKEGLPDSRRDLSYFEYATIGQRNAHGKHLRALVNEHNKAADALESMMREKDAPITDEQIKHMVQRFLSWRLPEHFSPDAGISFTPEFNVEYNAARGLPPQRHTPVGTNLFDANQAEEMVRYMVEGLPRAALDMTVDKGE